MATEPDLIGAGLDIEGWNLIKLEHDKPISCLTDHSHIQRQSVALVQKCHLPDDLIQQANEIILGAIEHKIVLDPEWIAEKIKIALDSAFGPSWHVVIGENFSFSIDFEKDYLYYLYYGGHAVLVWKCGDLAMGEVNHISDPKTKKKLKKRKKAENKKAKASNVFGVGFRDLFVEKI